MGKFFNVLKKGFLYTISVLAGLLLIAMLLSYVFEDKIKMLAIRELNKHLQAEVLISTQDIHFSVICNFPNASLSFEHFKIKESYPGSDKYFAQVGRLSLVFNTLELIRGHYTISRIDLVDADIAMRINRLGEGNYLFWKSDTTAATPGAEALSINLKHINLKNVHYVYDDQESEFLTAVRVDKARLSGRFSDVQYDLDADAALFMEKLSAGSLTLVTNKALNLNTVLAINSQAESYIIKKSALELGKAGFIVSGQAVGKPKGTDLDFHVKGKETDIQTLIALLPSDWAKPLADYQSQGRILFEASVKGLAGANSVPAIAVDFGIRNGTIREKNKSLALEGVNLKGSFTNGEARSNKTTVLQIEDFHARLKGRDLDGSCKLQNLDDPYLQLSLSGDLNLGDVKDFATLDHIKDLSGELFLDASFRGRLKDLESYKTIGRTTMAGKMQIRNVNLWYEGQPAAYAGMNAGFVFDGNNLLIDDFTGKYANTDFRLNGAFKNLASYLFLENQSLEADAALQCNLFRLDDFMTASSGTAAAPGSPDTVIHFAFPAFLICDMRVQVAQFEYGKMKAANLTGRLVLRDKTASLTDIRFNTMGGRLAANGQIQQLDNGRLRTYMKAELTDIDVSELFYEMDNFGQEYFTNKHIKGNLNANVEYSSQWLPNLDADLNSIAATASITIDNGQIINFPPFVKMGNFLKINSLDNLTFNKLSNTVSIANQVITIPRMDLSSNAMNMSLAGTHTFSNVMDYKLQMNISQLLFGRKKDYENEFGTVEVDENGGLNLFLTMSGPGSSPKIAYDRKSSMANFKKGLKQEKAEIKSILTGSSATTPDGKPAENLNKVRKEYEVSFDDEDTVENNVPKKDPSGTSLPSQTDQKRKKAFDELKKKLSNKPE